MKKIIVSTFSDTLDNYGQVLQYLATQIYFEKLGAEASLLKRKVRKHSAMHLLKIRMCVFQKNIKNWLTRRFENVKNNSEVEERQTFFSKAKLMAERNEKKWPRHFEDFRIQYFNITSYTDLLNHYPKADVYCVGSDQYWSWCGDENFLNYGSNETKRISLAASFGAYRPSCEKEWECLANKLKRFDFISVRELSGKEICDRAGRPDAIVVPDPTMLIHAEDYKKYEAESLHNKKEYVFLYLLGNPTEIKVSDVFDFAAKENLDVVYVTSQGREDSYPKVYPTVSQWLYYIKHAKFVMTNSFHGTAFSIVYHKPFLVFPLVRPFEKMNDRITTLLEDHHLENRIFYGVYDIIKEVPDYSLSDAYLSTLRNCLDNKIKKIINI